MTDPWERMSTIKGRHSEARTDDVYCEAENDKPSVERTFSLCMRCVDSNSKH